MLVRATSSPETSMHVVRLSPLRGVYALAVLCAASVTLASCTKVNPLYCMKDADCQPGQWCEVPARECQSGPRPVSDGGALDGSRDGSGSGRDGSSVDGPGPDGRVSCGTNEDCAARDPSRPTCEVGTCVGCVQSVQCKAEVPICGPSQRCVGCTTTPQCAALGDPSRSACEPTTGQCVECLTSATCSSEKPICKATHQCGGCTADPECAALGKPAQSVCDTGRGACVECLTSAQCSNPAAPICNQQTHTCEPCTTDAECAAKAPSPGVCEGGRCATEAETIFVENRAGCGPSGGTATTPLCGLADVPARLMANRALVVVRGVVEAKLVIASTPAPVTIVGQRGSSGDIATAGVVVGSAIQQSGGELRVRDLFLSGGQSSSAAAVEVSGVGSKLTVLRTRIAGAAGVGLRAGSGSQLTVNRSTFENNAGGGIVIEGAAYNITNSVVAGNGVGVQFSSGIPAGSRFQSNTVLSVVACASSSPQTLQGSIVTGVNVSCTLENTVTSTPDFDQTRPYHLKARLPCPGGDPTTFPPDDIDGQPRTSPVDCGADQYVP